MRLALWLAGAALLGGCGADGEPIPPSASVTLNNSGVSVGTSVGYRHGPVALSLGLGL